MKRERKKEPGFDELIEMFGRRARELMEASLKPVIAEFDTTIASLGGKFDRIDSRLREIGAMSDSIEGQLKEMQLRSDAIDRKLMVNAHRVRSVAKKQTLQQEQIEELKRRVEELAGEDSSAVIRRDAKKVAIDRDAAYKAIDEVAKKKHRAAMRALHEAGILCRDHEGKYTTTVWDPNDGKTVRAVVVIREVGADV